MSASRWRLWPRHLGSQLAAVVMLGVLAAHGLALLVTRHRTEVLNPLSQSQVAERMVGAYRVASSHSVGDDFHPMTRPVGPAAARIWLV